MCKIAQKNMCFAFIEILEFYKEKEKKIADDRYPMGVVWFGLYLKFIFFL